MRQAPAPTSSLSYDPLFIFDPDTTLASRSSFIKCFFTNLRWIKMGILDVHGPVSFVPPLLASRQPGTECPVCFIQKCETSVLLTIFNFDRKNREEKDPYSTYWIKPEKCNPYTQNYQMIL